MHAQLSLVTPQKKNRHRSELHHSRARLLPAVPAPGRARFVPITTPSVTCCWLSCVRFTRVLHAAAVFRSVRPDSRR
ncbi:hypothetical protein BVI2075_230064 [Burkholderia vietnamiensis]|nr:hypothetical protein BVI2075_230064 [Burkholderia vietnamiensis]